MHFCSFPFHVIMNLWRTNLISFIKIKMYYFCLWLKFEAIAFGTTILTQNKVSFVTFFNQVRHLEWELSYWNIKFLTFFFGLIWSNLLGWILFYFCLFSYDKESLTSCPQWILFPMIWMKSSSYNFLIQFSILKSILHICLVT